MDTLNAQQQSYVEDMGLYFEQYGSQRTLGKVIGLLLIAEQPLSQEELMRSMSCFTAGSLFSCQGSTDPGISWPQDACNRDLSIPFERT